MTLVGKPSDAVKNIQGTRQIPDDMFYDERFFEVRVNSNNTKILAETRAQDQFTRSLVDGLLYTFATWWGGKVDFAYLYMFFCSIHLKKSDWNEIFK